MKMLCIISLIGTICWANTANAEVSAFGITSNMERSDLTIVKKTENANQFMVAVPEPDNAFTAYSVVTSSQGGLCSVIGVRIKQDSAADSVVILDTMARSLVREFGTPDRDGDSETVWSKKGGFYRIKLSRMRDDYVPLVGTTYVILLNYSFVNPDSVQCRP